MLIAQALGEYAALSVIIGAASDFSIRLEENIGSWGTEGLIALILKQDACPRWVAGKLITYFEGVPPSAERLAEYAVFLLSR